MFKKIKSVFTNFKEDYQIEMLYFYEGKKYNKLRIMLIVIQIAFFASVLVNSNYFNEHYANLIHPQSAIHDLLTIDILAFLDLFKFVSVILIVIPLILLKIVFLKDKIFFVLLKFTISLFPTAAIIAAILALSSLQFETAISLFTFIGFFGIVFKKIFSHNRNTTQQHIQKKSPK